MLCKIALGWFFLWRKSGTVVAVGVPDVFLPCGWIGLLIFSRNEKKQCANLWVDSKKCDRKKTTAGWMCGSRNKDRASPASTGSATVRLADMEIRGGALFPAGERSRCRSCP